MAIVYFSAPFFKKTNSLSMEVSAGSLNSCLEQIFNKYPDIKSYILSDGELTPFVKIFINQIDSSNLSGLGTNININDEIQILLAVAGG